MGAKVVGPWWFEDLRGTMQKFVKVLIASEGHTISR